MYTEHALAFRISCETYTPNAEDDCIFLHTYGKLNIWFAVNVSAKILFILISALTVKFISTFEIIHTPGVT